MLSFLGLVGYYRRFLRDLAQKERSLRDQCKPAEKFELRPEHRAALAAIKKAVSQRTILAFPTTERKFIIDTDASDAGLGAVLSQLDDEGVERPIAFASRGLSDLEKKYSAVEKECLAIVWAITKQFHAYVCGAEFLLRTDNQPLSWLKTLRDPPPRLGRCILKIREYKLDVLH